MSKSTKGTNAGQGKIIRIDEDRIKNHLGELVRGTVEETLNAMLDAEAEQQIGAGQLPRQRRQPLVQAADLQFLQARHLPEPFDVRFLREGEVHPG